VQGELCDCVAAMQKERFVVGLLDKRGRPTPGSDGVNLEDIAASTLQRCTRNDKSLRALELSGTLFTSLFLTELTSALSHNTALQEMYLDNCRIGDEGARVLAHGLASRDDQSLRLLSLEANEIRCRGAAHLAKILDAPGARWGRTFGGYTAPVFGPGRGLRHFSLKFNGVGCVGARAIAESLSQSDVSLETLNLEANEIGDWAAGWLAMVLRNHNVLQQMNLCCNPIGNDGLEELRTACETARATLVVQEQQGQQGQQQQHVHASEDCPTAPAEGNVLTSGERLCTVYISEARLGSETGDCWRPTGAFRPGSASRRQASGTRRHNAVLGIDEPGAVMANSIASCSHVSSRPSSAARSRPSSACLHGGNRGASRPSSAATTAAQLSSRPGSASKCSSSTLDSYIRDEASSITGFAPDVGGGAWGPRRPSARKAFARSTSTYAAGHVSDLAMSGDDAAVEAAAANAVFGSALSVSSSQCVAPMNRLLNGERGVAIDEKETATALVAPSRWMRKPRDIPEGPRCRAGSGATAARHLRRSCSMPSRHRPGMLMGPLAASAICA